MAETGYKTEQFGSPEDVTTLFAWANMRGARYRDFSSSRARMRDEIRRKVEEAAEEEHLRQLERAQREEQEAMQRAAQEAAARAEMIRRAEAERMAEIARHAETERQAVLAAQEAQRRAKSHRPHEAIPPPVTLPEYARSSAQVPFSATYSAESAHMLSSDVDTEGANPGRFSRIETQPSEMSGHIDDNPVPRSAAPEGIRIPVSGLDHQDWMPGMMQGSMPRSMPDATLHPEPIPVQFSVPDSGEDMDTPVLPSWLTELPQNEFPLADLPHARVQEQPRARPGAPEAPISVHAAAQDSVAGDFSSWTRTLSEAHPKQEAEWTGHQHGQEQASEYPPERGQERALNQEVERNAEGGFVDLQEFSLGEASALRAVPASTQSHPSGRMSEYSAPTPLWPQTPTAADRATLAAASGMEIDPLAASRERITRNWYALKSIFHPEQELARAPDRVPVLAVFSLAGGVGKTSFLASMARALSSRSEQVLLVDMSAYGLMPFFFGARDQKPGQLRTFTPAGTTADAPIQLITLDPDRLGVEPGGQDALLRAIQQHSGGVHRLLLDLPTASGEIMRRVLRLNPTVLVPVTPDMNSVVSVQAIESYFRGQNLGSAGQIEPLYLLNRFDPSQQLHVDIRNLLQEQLGGRLLPFVLRSSPVVSEALAEGMTVMDYAPGAAIAEDYLNLANWIRSISAPAAIALRGARWSER